MQYKDDVKHISARWLSLEFAVECALKQYKGLKSYFLSNAESQPRFQRLQKALDQPITEVYLLFFQAALPVFTSLNKLLQRETPCMHLLH